MQSSILCGHADIATEPDGSLTYVDLVEKGKKLLEIIRFQYPTDGSGMWLLFGKGENDFLAAVGRGEITVEMVEMKLAAREVLERMCPK